ncbi:hypothetical protein KKHLCK_12385 [Candidatus Electrothrix laxa]
MFSSVQCKPLLMLLCSALIIFSYGSREGSASELPHFITESYPSQLAETTYLINSELKPDLVKMRIKANFVTSDYQSFSTTVCMPSTAKCIASYDLDQVAAVFKKNGWSMMPMLSHDSQLTKINKRDITNYIRFVSWFLDRYKAQANIQYIELLNDPNKFWPGTDKQLLSLTNQTYDTVKSKHPSIKVGTAGMEYWADTQEKGWARTRYMLDPSNGLKFDFWAFHAYPLAEMSNQRRRFISLPPTRTPVENQWAGNTGIVLLRKQFNDNGWQDRAIIDTEHVFVTPGRENDFRDRLGAAYMVQDFAIKTGLKLEGNPAIQGVSGLKLIKRGMRAEMAWGSLSPNGSATERVKSVGLFWQKVKGMQHKERISGEFDQEDTLWIEKYAKDNGDELYVYFKPFEYHQGRNITFDNVTLTHALRLPKTPKEIIHTSLYGATQSKPVSNQVLLSGTNEPQFIEIKYR